ncbi:MAG: nucleotidyltransferase family protein [Cyclobacteriaceae bacterium]|nr:nucleotidyltransferase family protein [Cyclobacteriaceae bacterium]
MQLKKDEATVVLSVIAADEWVMDKLRVVHSLGYKNCWLGAGIIRNSLWDHLHGYEQKNPLNDIDVILIEDGFTEEKEKACEKVLTIKRPEVKWSVKDQLLMAKRFQHKPYKDCSEALSHWVETATAVAVRLNRHEKPEIIAPYGLSDLLGLILRPTSAAMRPVMEKRLVEKGWIKQYPKLKVVF